jgi:hypothetical protein
MLSHTPGDCQALAVLMRQEMQQEMQQVMRPATPRGCLLQELES